MSGCAYTGLFITIEGVDGSGKSTQIRLIEEEMSASGTDALFTREPGGCSISEKIRDIVLDNGNMSMLPQTEALLYAASRAQHVREVILPALQKGRIVICDRYLDSSIAYQVYGRLLREEDIRSINEFATQGLMPDYTLFFHVERSEAQKRASSRSVKDRMESMGNGFEERVTQGYEMLFSNDDARVCRIDASGSKEQTHALAMKKLNEILSCHRNKCDR